MAITPDDLRTLVQSPMPLDYKYPFLPTELTLPGYAGNLGQGILAPPNQAPVHTFVQKVSSSFGTFQNTPQNFQRPANVEKPWPPCKCTVRGRAAGINARGKLCIFVDSPMQLIPPTDLPPEAGITTVPAWTYTPTTKPNTVTTMSSTYGTSSAKLAGQSSFLSYSVKSYGEYLYQKVNSSQALRIVTDVPPNISQGQVYPDPLGVVASPRIEATGGIKPYLYYMNGNPAIPAGITLNRFTGVFEGVTGAALGVYPITVSIKDVDGKARTQNFAIVVVP